MLPTSTRGVAGWMCMALLSALVAADGHKSTGDPLQALPDVFPPAQSSFHVTITYKGGAVCDSKHGGVEFSKDETSEAPALFQSPDGTVDVNQLHTLVMIDPDAPNRVDPTLGEVLHHVQTDLIFSEGNLITTVAPLVDYAGPAPPEGSGPHRYIYLLFRQPGPVALSGFSADARLNFDVVRFARENQFGPPVAGCFFVVNGGGMVDEAWKPEDYKGGDWYVDSPTYEHPVPTTTDCTTTETPVYVPPTTTDCTTTETPVYVPPTTTDCTTTETPVYVPPTTTDCTTTETPIPWYPTTPPPTWSTSTIPWNNGNYSVTKVEPIPPPVYTIPPPVEEPSIPVPPPTEPSFTPPPVEPPVYTPPPVFPGNGTNGTYIPPAPTYQIPENPPVPSLPPSPVEESDGAAADMSPMKGSFVAIMAVGVAALFL